MQLPFQSAPRSLCVLRLSAIGDVCHTLPVVRSIQSRWPETHITWVMGRTEAGLVGDVEDIESITFDKRGGPRAWRELRERLRGRRFDALLMMQAALRASVTSLAIGADIRLGFDRPRARDFQWLFSRERIPHRPRQHVMEALFGFAETIGATAPGPVDPDELRWDIPVPEEAEQRAAQIIPDDAPTLLISPCSSQRSRNFRNWRAERYAAVAEHAAREHGLRTVITGGPSELEKAYGHRIRELAACEVVDMVGRTDLKSLFATIRRARVVLCPDSGPAHMATAAGTPVIGLYAGSNPDRTGPFLSRRWVVDRYPEALRRSLGRSVDEVRWGQRVRDPDVMDLIEVDAVRATLDELMAETGTGEAL